MQARCKLLMPLPSSGSSFSVSVVIVHQWRPPCFALSVSFGRKRCLGHHLCSPIDTDESVEHIDKYAY